MKIILNTGSMTELETVKKFLNFNWIEYEEHDIFDNQLDTFGRNTLNHNFLIQDKTLLIINYDTFEDLCDWSVSRQEIIDFCQQGNHIWIWKDLDGLIRTSKICNTLFDIDNQIPKNKIVLFFDGVLDSQSPAHKLLNIKLSMQPDSFFMHLMRIEKASIKKTNCQYDFMLTMGHQRVHRDALWNNLSSKPDLLAHGAAVYHRLAYKDLSDYSTPQAITYKKNHIGVRREGSYCSMDLYNNSWLEIVPETLGEHGYFFTEKTAKPISTKTPFLLLSSPGYLKYLHSLGFKTFDSLIDESYDSEPNLETRVEMLVDQLQNIVNNGAKDFYYACKSILDYNHNKLAERAGLWNYRMDQFLIQHLEEAGFE